MQRTRSGNLRSSPKHGHRVTYLVARTPQWDNALTDVSTLKLQCLEMRKSTPGISLLAFELGALRQIAKSITRFDVIIFDVNSILPVLPIALLSRLFHQRPVALLRIQSIPVETGGKVRKWLITILDRISIMLAVIFLDMILFISPMLSASYAAKLSIPTTKIGIWSSSVDTDLFDPSSIAETDHTRRARPFDTCRSPIPWIIVERQSYHRNDPSIQNPERRRHEGQTHLARLRSAYEHGP